MTLICETIWEVANIKNTNNKVMQFAGSLRKMNLTWYKNFNQNQTKTKNKIKQSLLTFFRIKDVRHLVAQKLKEIGKLQGESVRYYDK